MDHSNQQPLEQYFELIKRFPSVIEPQGSAAQGEIEILVDPDSIAEITKSDDREVGVVAQDQHWVWLNDACLFPSGHKGVHGRVLWVKALTSSSGVAVMPRMPDGKIVLNCHFRHATRAWEIELPRGGIEAGEDLQTAAKRETQEETGMIIDHLVKLGEVASDTGFSNTVIPVFLAQVIRQEQARREPSEAIEEVLVLSINEIKEAFGRGYHTCLLRGVQKNVAFRDPFLAYAVLMYELKQSKS